jgi:hypothetical protein
MLTDAKSQSTEWTSFVCLTAKTLVSGEVVKAPALLMQRLNDAGHVEYRRPTAEEESEYVAREAW